MAQRSLITLVLFLLSLFAARVGVSQDIKAMMMALPTCASTCTAPNDAPTKECCACEPCQADGSFDPDFTACLNSGCPAPANGTGVPGTALRFPPGPNYPCRGLGRLNPNWYSCCEYLAVLKGSFPEDLKSAGCRDALVELNNRGLLDGPPRDLGAKVITLAATPNDPQFAEQAWQNLSSDYDIGTQDSWEVVTGTPAVVVAVIDSGVDTAHPDLQGNLDVAGGYDFNANVADVTDAIGHGTHAAGVIGAVGNNGVGVAGINWSVKILPLKITDAGGSASLMAGVEAFNRAIEKGAQVANCSWVANPSPENLTVLQTAVQSFVDAGGVVVAAAGNVFPSGGKDIDAEPLYPAAFDLPGVIAVAAVEPTLALSAFSNYGAASVDLAAPGAGILSTGKDATYVSSKGTSVAASLVSGAAALVKAYKPALTPAEIRSLLMSTVKPSEGLSGKVASGGSLSLRNALASLGAELPAPVEKATKTADTVVSSAPAASSPSASSGKSGGGCSMVLP